MGGCLKRHARETGDCKGILDREVLSAGRLPYQEGGISRATASCSRSRVGVDHPCRRFLFHILVFVCDLLGDMVYVSEYINGKQAVYMQTEKKKERWTRVLVCRIQTRRLMTSWPP